MQISRKVEAIVFDLDGTLYVNLPFGRNIMAAAVEYLAPVLGTDTAGAEDAVRTIKKTIAGKTGVECSLSLACTTLGGSLRDMHGFFARVLRPEEFLARDDRMTAVLAKLSRKFSLYLYTNNNVAVTERILSIIGGKEYFRKIFTVEDTWRPKPDRETLEAIIAEVSGSPEKTLFVGDRYDIDLRLPAELGCPVYRTGTMEDFFMLDGMNGGETT